MLFQNCAVTKKMAYPEMYEKPPLSIFILPPINQSTAAEAQEFYQTTISEPLTLTGYYAYPMEVVVDILKTEGMYETVDFRTVNPAQFKKFFGADAVLHVSILKWDKVYYVIGGYVTVSIDMNLVSTETGKTIWRYNGTLKIDTSSNAGGSGLAGLVIKAVATAVTTAVTDYVPIAKKANIQALTAIPYGKYHPKHLKDGNLKAVNTKTLEKTGRRE
jgi:hypothetical protein